MAAASLAAVPVDQHGDGQGPKITSVTRLAIRKRLLAEGADISLCTAALNHDTCRAIVEAAIRRDLVHAKALRPERQAIFMHERRFMTLRVRRHGRSIAQAMPSEGWIPAPGTYYRVGDLIYIVDETNIVRTTLVPDDIQLQRLDEAETSTEEYTCEPVLDRIRAELNRQPQEPPMASVGYVLRSARQTSRLTPHLPSWLRNSRLGLLIVAADERQYAHICSATTRIADADEFSPRPQIVLVDSAVRQDGREVLVELLGGASNEDAAQGIRVVALPDSPSHDWDDALQKLPTDVRSWWNAFSGFELPRDITAFPVILTPGLARMLLQVLQPGSFRQDNWRTYNNMFVPGAALDLHLGNVKLPLQKKRRFL